MTTTRKTTRKTTHKPAEPPAEAPAAEAKPKPEPKLNYFDTKPGRLAVKTLACPICEQAAGSLCLSRKGTETIYIHPARFEAYLAAEAKPAPEPAAPAKPKRTRKAATILGKPTGRSEAAAKAIATKTAKADAAASA